MQLDQENENTHITCIGDSTIDNKIWVDGPMYTYLMSRFGINRDEAATRVAKASNSWLKPSLSVVENLMALMPHHQIHDYTNDGFTTTDVISGNYKDKVFPTGAFLSFPNTHFRPLVSAKDDIERSKYIILSIGGNNFRELLTDANNYTGKHRQDFIKEKFQQVFNTIHEEYVDIVQRLRNMNSAATIILMTQYYPSVAQNNYKIYEFMGEIGALMNLGGGSS